jgi:hypothetical protein
MLLHCIGGGG